MSRSQGLRVLSGLRSQLIGNEVTPAMGLACQQSRGFSSVPEYWGRDSPYHPGTDFLGTPKNHLDLVAKRPLSPHVFEIDHKQMHYKMPLTATSSILNRVTGVMLSVGFGGVGLLSLKNGDLGAMIASYKAAYPLLVYPAKFAIAFPLAYHYLAAVRHMYWDHYKYGNMIDKNSPLELQNIQASSKAVIIGGAVVAAGLAVYSI